MMMQNRKEGENFPISLERATHVFIIFLLMLMSGYSGFTPPLYPLVPRPVSNVLQDLSPGKGGGAEGGRSAGASWPNDDGRVTAPFARKKWEMDVAFGRTTESRLPRSLFGMSTWCLFCRGIARGRLAHGIATSSEKLLHAVTPASSGSVSVCVWMGLSRVSVL